MKHAYFPKRVFARRIAYQLRQKDIYGSERVAHAVRLFSAFLAADIRGLTPPTRHRWYENAVIYAKPDLQSHRESLDLTEFKTTPLDEYARLQTTVMAWVFDEPILLAGTKTDEETGWVEIEEETIEPSSVPIERYIKELR